MGAPDLIALGAAFSLYTGLVLALVRWLAMRAIAQIDQSVKELRDGQKETKTELQKYLAIELTNIRADQQAFEKESMQDRIDLRQALNDLKAEIPREYLRRGELDHRLGSIEEGLNWIRNYLMDRRS